MIENLRLKELCPCNMARPTIAKTDFGNLACMNVLLPDQGFVFMLLEQSLKDIDAGSNVNVMVTLTKFGQKDGGILDLSEIVDTSYVKAISLHTACTISAHDPRVHLLWARHGLEEIVGARGKMFSALSMYEAANVSSNLDGKKMDVSFFEGPFV